jgi:hypothetical protein
MSQPRDLKTILEIILKNTEEYYNGFGMSSGLCYMAAFTQIITKEIDKDEYHQFKEYLYAHKPLAARLRNDNYFWSRHKVAPRIKWLKKHIRKLSKASNSFQG